ncbi:MAG: hypothetical protein AB1397_04040 [bacterium]
MPYDWISIILPLLFLRVLLGDTKIEDWKRAKLIQPSLVCGIIRTIKEDMVLHKIGKLSDQDFLKVKENLIKSIGFDIIVNSITLYKMYVFR